jgi:hypothetical protein
VLCWRISPTIPAGARVKLSFSRVEVENNYDFIRVRLGAALPGALRSMALLGARLLT